jgi:hypothetical protein
VKKETILQRLRRRFKGKACPLCGRKFFNRGRHTKAHQDAINKCLREPNGFIFQGAAGKEGERR